MACSVIESTRTSPPMGLVLTRQQFASAAKEVLRMHNERCNKDEDDPILHLYQGWDWQQHSVSPSFDFGKYLTSDYQQSYSNLGYLRRSVTVHDDWPPEVEDLGADDAVFETPDASEAPASPPLRHLIMQQYVAWSGTFQVPVFYFTLQDAGECHLLLCLTAATEHLRRSSGISEPHVQHLHLSQKPSACQSSRRLNICALLRLIAV